MKHKRQLSYLALLIGSILVIYELNDVVNHPYLLAVGIICLMAGLFGLYIGISPKPETNNYIQTEDEEE